MKLDFLDGGRWKLKLWQDADDSGENAEHLAVDEQIRLGRRHDHAQARPGRRLRCGTSLDGTRMHTSSPMRIAFRMQVHPGQEAEYIRRHNPIWPELEAKLKEHGVRDYSIFLDRATGDLFAYAEIEDLARWQSIANTDICRKWWASMAPLMPANPDTSPVARDLEEVFHIEADR